MGQYAGLDVPLKEISICVVDGEGCVVRRSTVVTDPETIAQHFAEKGLCPDRIVHESGQLSIWLHRRLEKLGLPIICIDASLAHKALSAKLNKSDKADAEGLAQLARTGWCSEVHIRSEASDQLHLLLNARERLVDEPQRKLPRQRPNGELLQLIENRNGSPNQVPDAARGKGRALRVHRDLLQPPTAPL